MTAPMPRRVEFAGPEGWVVWMDEDGCHLRAHGGACLEVGEVKRLFDLWTECMAMHQRGEVPAPRPMSREEVRNRMAVDREKWSGERAVRAIRREFNDDGEAAF